MTSTDPTPPLAARHDAIRSERLDLVALSPEVIDAVLAGRREEAGSLVGATVPPGWPDEHDARWLRRRADQMRERPEDEFWLVRGLVHRADDRPLIGHAGFHGPPGTNGLKKAGAVEVGYTIFAPFRGSGYATEAVRALIAWAGERGVEHFIASVAPDNAPSLAVVRKLGFVQTGTQWDEEDGEELVFELTSDGRT